MSSLRTLLFVAGVIGRKPFLVFGLVSLLAVFLLAAVNVSSREALRAYIADQLDRVPWDISVYQTADYALAPGIARVISEMPGVAGTEQMIFLRTVLPEGVRPFVDGKPMRTPWMSLLTAGDPRLIPADIRPEGGSAVLVLVGSREQMGGAYLNLQSARRFELRRAPGEVHAHDPHGPGMAHDHPADLEKMKALFGVDIGRTLRVDRNEINRWFLDKTSAPTLVPELGAILVINRDDRLLTAFDRASRGIVHQDEGDDFHVNPGEYFPEVIHLARLDRGALISPWDAEAGAARLEAIAEDMSTRVREVSYGAAVDNVSGVLLARMAEIARRIGLITLLVSLPLLWIAWILLANLSGLLILNQRRTFGLLRLRGVPSRVIGLALMAAVAAGGLAGGGIGAVLGTAAPLLAYTGGLPPWEIIAKIQSPALAALFVAVGTVLVLLVSLRLIRYAARISPLEAAVRVAPSEATTARVRFGPLEAACLFLGGFKVAGWIFGFSAADWWPAAWPASWIESADRALDFISFPLLVYGVATLVASRQKLLMGLLAPTALAAGGRLGGLALHHMASRAHRMAAFLLIVALMASLSLYPTVMTAVFDAKTLRGAEVRLGAPLHVTLNGASLVPPAALAKGGLADRMAALEPALADIAARLSALDEVAETAVLVEGLVDGLYMPGYGFSGVPIYLLRDAGAYGRAVSSEAALGTPGGFAEVLARLGSDNGVAVSPAVQGFYGRAVGTRMPVGRNTDRSMQAVSLAGSIGFLPGMPQKTVNERASFVQTRVDYLNHMFGFNAYLVAADGNPRLKSLDALVLRVVLAIRPAPGVPVAQARKAVEGTLPAPPLEVRVLEEEVARLGSDMYIFLARANFTIYMLGGLLLSLIGILAIAASNFAEDRRTLALLRVRGAGPAAILGFTLPGLLAPSLVGLALGGAVALAVGFGITDLVWRLREIVTILNILPTRLVISAETVLAAGFLVAVLVAVSFAVSRWVFARTAREGLNEG